MVDQLTDYAKSHIPSIDTWASPVAALLQGLADTPEEDFNEALADAIKCIPDLFDLLDDQPLIDAMEGNQRVGWFVGWGENAEIDEVSAAKREKKYKGKRCGSSWIAMDRKCWHGIPRTKRERDATIHNQYKEALINTSASKEIELGYISKRAEGKFNKAHPPVGAKDDLSTYKSSVSSSHIRHINKNHGDGNEKNKKQIPVTADDIKQYPAIAYSPDHVRAGYANKRTGNQRFLVAKSIKGKKYRAVIEKSKKHRRLKLITMWIRK